MTDLKEIAKITGGFALFALFAALIFTCWAAFGIRQILAPPGAGQLGQFLGD